MIGSSNKIISEFIRLVENYLEIRSYERKEVVYFWFYNFSIWFVLGITELIAEALFIKRVGVEFLPYMFIISSLFAIPISILYQYFLEKYSKNEVTQIITVFTIYVYSICYFLFYYSKVFPVLDQIACYFLYLCQNMINLLWTSQLSILFTGKYNTLDAKRLIPIILSGTLLSLLISGLFIIYFASSMGLENILLILVLGILLSYIWYMLLCRDYFKISILQQVRSSDSEYLAGSFLYKLFLQAKELFNNKFILSLSLSVFILTLIRYFYEFIYSDIFNRYFHTDTELANFFGNFIIISNLSALFIQSTVTPKVIQYFGVASSSVLFPSISLFTFFVLIFSHSLWCGIIVRYNQECIRRAFYVPIFNLLYNALPSKKRNLAISFNESVIVPFATIVSSTIIMYFYDKIAVLAYIGLCVCGIWMLLSIKLKILYTNNLLESLRRSLVEKYKYSNICRDFDIIDSSSIKVLLSNLENENEEISRLAAELILQYADYDSKLKLLKKITNFQNNVPYVFILLQRLNSFKLADAKHIILYYLNSDNSKFREEILKQLITYPYDDEIRNKIFEFLDSDSRREQLFSAANFIKGSDIRLMHKGLEIFKRYMYSSDENEVIDAIEALGEIKEERFWINLVPFLKSCNDKIRLSAIKSTYLLVNEGQIYDNIELFYNLSKDKVKEIRKYAIMILGKIRSINSVPYLIDALSDPSPTNRAIALEILSEYGSKIESDLLMILDDLQADIESQVSAIKLLMLSQETYIKQRILEFGYQKIKMIYEMKIDEFVIANQSEDIKENLEYLKMIINDKIEANIKLVLNILTPKQKVLSQSVIKHIYSKDIEEISNALELLQIMGEDKLICYLIPILERLPYEFIVKYAIQKFNLSVPELKHILGKYLKSIDYELKEAAMYTIAKIKLKEHLPTLLKMKETLPNVRHLQETYNWAIQALNN